MKVKVTFGVSDLYLYICSIKKGGGGINLLFYKIMFICKEVERK